jgi:hypothetical protein
VGLSCCSVQLDQVESLLSVVSSRVSLLGLVILSLCGILSVAYKGLLNISIER